MQGLKNGLTINNDFLVKVLFLKKTYYTFGYL